MKEERSCFGHLLRFVAVILIFASVMVIVEYPEWWQPLGIAWLGLAIISAVARVWRKRSGRDTELENLRNKYWDQARREGKHIDELQGFIPDDAWKDIREGWKPGK